MKSKNLLFLLTATCLFSCQQQDELDNQSKESINIVTSIDNENITNALTRTGSSLALPLKSSFSPGEIISMSINDQDYIPYTLGVNNHLCSESGVNGNGTFYAHYPELDLSSNMTTTRAGKRFREIEGGKEYLFGTAQAIFSSSNINLKFKRMTVPVILVDEDGRPYAGKADVKLFLKNKGIQDLLSGIIEVDKNAESKYVNIKKISDGILTNLIPQVIKKGETIGTVIEDGKEEPIIADHDISLEAGQPVMMRIAGHIGILDDRTPLFY